MRRFYAPKVNSEANNVTLNEDETRHLRDVLRLRLGERINVFDGDGAEFLGEIIEIGKKETSLKILEHVSPLSPESTLDLTLAIALLKGEKFDLVIQKAVELGVTTLVPLETMRCDVKLKDSGKKIERWRKIVLEASKQSGRARLMKIEEPVALKAFLKNAKGAVLFSERNGESFSSIAPGKQITAIIGPEGGWDDSELDAARERGTQIVTLGGRILRAETAAISIAAVLQHRFGDLA